jgi:ABC-2 type transport system ATP-binding protein
MVTIEPAVSPPPAAAPPEVDAAVRTRALTKLYAGRAAVDRVDVVVPRGMISGFVGPNGAG